jgi:hypothetical protein
MNPWINTNKIYGGGVLILPVKANMILFVHETAQQNSIAIGQKIIWSKIRMVLKQALNFDSLYTCKLKGQCHEMVVEVRPWSGSLALN